MINAIYGKKIGMTQIFGEDDRVVPVTVIQAEPNKVCQVKTKATDGYEAVQMGFGAIKEKKVKDVYKRQVQPCAGIEPVVEDGVVRSAGDTILSADDKAGIAAILEGVRSVVEEGAPRPDVTVLLTTCEEQHLLGSGALAPDALPAGAPCYVLDADGAPGTVITGAPCHWTLEAAFAGRASHAGVVPEAGISAIQMAAAAIEAMPLGRLDEATTANIGVIAGGRETNVVPEACTLRGECRSLYPDRAEAQKAAMTAALEQAAARFGGSVDIDWTFSYGAVLYDEDDALVQTAARAARAAGLEPCFRHDGGGSDANVLAARGVRAVTLGVGMAAFHSYALRAFSGIERSEVFTLITLYLLSLIHICPEILCTAVRII